jgi:hypothetical protein
MLNSVVAHNPFFVQPAMASRKRASSPASGRGTLANHWALLLLVAAVVVLSVWTRIDRYHWEREIIDKFTGETFGICKSVHFLIFAISLVCHYVSSNAFAWLYGVENNRYLKRVFR